MCFHVALPGKPDLLPVPLAAGNLHRVERALMIVPALNWIKPMEIRVNQRDNGRDENFLGDQSADQKINRHRRPEP
jgi:hypothetical protein